LSRRAFIIGGTGQIGRAVANDLLALGWEVFATHRGRRAFPRDLTEKGANAVVLDRDEPGALGRAIGSGLDAILDTTAYSAQHADQLLEIEQDVGSFVVISSSSVYRDGAGRTLDEAAKRGFPDFPTPLKESQPTVEPGAASYSTKKVALERRLLDGAVRPVTILRPGAVHGPYSSHPREWWFVKRMLDGRGIIPIVYGGKSRFHTTAAVNVAAMVRVALEAPGARILNIADPSALSVAEIGAALAAHLDYRGAFLALDDKDYPPRLGATPWSVPAPFTLDVSAAAALGYKPVATYRRASKETCDWLTRAAPRNWREAFPVLASYPQEHFDYAAEDSFLQRRRAT
jgi:nucleoside-diphosphate-sugar epimerase